MDVTPSPGPAGRSHRLSPLSALAAMVLAATASAQPSSLPGFELERLELNPSGAGSLLVGTGELLPEGGYRLSLLGHYESAPLLYYRNGRYAGAIVGHRLTTHLTASYAPLRWLELGAQLPLVLFQRGDDLRAEGIAPPWGGVALSTPVLNARVGLLSQSQDAPVDLALGLGAGLPLGSAEALARDAGIRLTPSIMVGRHLGWLRAGFEAGVLVRPHVVVWRDVDVDEIGSHLRLGGTLATTGEGLRGEVNVLASAPFTRERVALETLGAIRLPLGASFEAFVMGGVGIGRPPGTPAFRGLLGLAFSGGPEGKPDETKPGDPNADDDGDGVRNADDACPNEGGKVDASGCPVKDGDGDGVADAEDRCPDEAGTAQHGGCPAPKDSDGDGVADAEDRCPDEAGTAQHGGCPAPKDSDGDGVADAEDRCPDEAGTAQDGGCPAPKDSDGDGVADPDDRCPTEKGLAREQGCPAKPAPVSIEGDQLVTLEPIVFLIGEPTVEPRLHPQLDEVARFLQQHPELKRITIEGHTDNTGPEQLNQQLSEQRAQSVRAYLVRKGVNPARLATRGYSFTRPRQSNDTEEGRAANRRVEFVITSRARR